MTMNMFMTTNTGMVMNTGTNTAMGMAITTTPVWPRSRP